MIWPVVTGSVWLRGGAVRTPLSHSSVPVRRILAKDRMLLQDSRWQRSERPAIGNGEFPLLAKRDPLYAEGYDWARISGSRCLILWWNRTKLPPGWVYTLKREKRAERIVQWRTHFKSSTDAVQWAGALKPSSRPCLNSFANSWINGCGFLNFIASFSLFLLCSCTHFTDGKFQPYGAH